VIDQAHITIIMVHFTNTILCVFPKNTTSLDTSAPFSQENLLDLNVPSARVFSLSAANTNWEWLASWLASRRGVPGASGECSLLTAQCLLFIRRNVTDNELSCHRMLLLLLRLRKQSDNCHRTLHTFPTAG